MVNFESKSQRKGSKLGMVLKEILRGEYNRDVVLSWHCLDQFVNSAWLFLNKMKMILLVKKVSLAPGRPSSQSHVSHNSPNDESKQGFSDFSENCENL